MHIEDKAEIFRDALRDICTGDSTSTVTGAIAIAYKALMITGEEVELTPDFAFLNKEYSDASRSD